ncbi:MAG: hypothetical protein WKF84_26780 [Pyrinomonadaceae bacterium]
MSSTQARVVSTVFFTGKWRIIDGQSGDGTGDSYVEAAKHVPPVNKAQ